MRRNCLLKRVIEENMEEMLDVTGRRGGRRKRLLDDLKEKRILTIGEGKHYILPCGEPAIEEPMNLS